MSQQPELLGVPKGEKHCAVCGEVKPATAFYFHRDPHADDGWNPKCKKCRKKYRKEQVNKEIAANITKVQTNILAEIASGSSRAAMCDLLSAGETVLDAFGGMDGLAAKLAADYEASEVGSASRTKLLLGVTALVMKAAEQAKPVDVKTMDTDTVQRLLKSALGDDYKRLTDESEDSPPVGDSE